ncbi:FRIGIDA-like protein 3 [Selaginella moellendorffii]|uniref:FRIGIDA-like protein 3 n=1 Tax=Selaginella moellendorffii TaxID=88036 RepID=UPI000D1CCF5E|nr:FRIGIDA-like protein 3 [Selaginella moellendorffii]XP_024530285.1 FRIGIDA-like protein 3 [Selaginella moellendorffii]|eukprot:XP_002960412.2 FRIGIDA-like protein 3 [Selaginella moellendorffii]
MEAMAARRERLQRAFLDLDKERQILSRCVSEWKELDEMLAETERDVQKRYDDLAAREKSFQERARELQIALDERERLVERREQEISAREQEERAPKVVVVKKESMVEEADLLAAAAAAQESFTLIDAVPSSISQSMDLDLNIPQESPSHDDELIDGRAVVGLSLSGTSGEVSVRPELKALCETMDGDGLRRFIVEHRKEFASLRHELPGALKCAVDPARMVVVALEAYLPDPSSSTRKASDASASRRACILLLECLQVVLADPVLGVDHPVVPSHVKEVAKDMAEKWRSRMDVQKDAAGGSSLDAQAFLQLLATFGISSEYDEEELCGLISAIARRKKTPALCRAIGLSARIPAIVDKLVEDGKPIEALSMAKEFGIMDRIQPVSLLKNYLKDARRIAHSMLKSGHSPAAAQNDSMMKELSATRSVLKCIEEYNLEADFPSSPLHKRIFQLEKAKLDKKRTGGSMKGQSKRPRGSNNGGYSYRNPDRNPERGGYVPPGPSVSGYQFVSPVAFERQNQGGYMPSYAPGSRSAVSLSSLPPNSYIYSPADGSIYGAPGYTTTPTNTYPSFGNLRNSLPPPPPAYQASFMH